MSFRAAKQALFGVSAFVVSAVGSTAQAQSMVTLYGAIDTGIRYTTNTTANGSSTWALGSGALMGSRFGLKGREDLGGGNTANFVLESGFVPSSGVFDQQGQLFGRQAWVGLENTTYGAIQAGRIYSLPFWQLSTYDTFTLPNYLAEAWETRLYGVRMDNSLKYTVSRDGVILQVQHSFGNQTGGFQMGSTNAVSLAYKNTHFAAGLLGQRSSDANDLHADVWSAGANYTVGRATLYGLYIWSRRDAGFKVGSTTGSALANTSILSNATTVYGTQTTARRDSYVSLGVNYSVSPDLKAGVALMLDNAAGITPVAGHQAGRIKTLVALVDYHLSKRTDVYVEFDRNVLNGASVNDSNSPVGSFNGHASSTGATLGLRTLF